MLAELSNLKVSLNCAIRSRANAKINADRAESKLEVSERVTSDLFEENKEVKQQLGEATSKAESLQSELLEANRTNILLKQKLDEYDLANKRFQESLTKKTTQIKDQSEIEKLVKQLQVMRVEIDIQRAEAIQLIQAVDGQQYGKLEKCLHALLTHEGTSRLDSRPYIIPSRTISTKIQIGKKSVPVSRGQSTQKTSPLERITQNKEKAMKTLQTLNSYKTFKKNFSYSQTFCIFNIYLTLNLSTLIC